MKFKLEGGNDNERCPIGTHNAVCVNVCDLGVQPGYNGSAPKQKVAFLFETATRREHGTYAGKPHLQSKIVSLSKSPKSNLVGMLKSWRGHDLTEEERKSGFGPEAFIGKPCTLIVSHEEKNGDVAARVSGVLPHNPASEVLVPERSRDDIPEWVTRMYEGRVRDPNPVASLPSLPETTSASEGAPVVTNEAKAQVEDAW